MGRGTKKGRDLRLMRNLFSTNDYLPHITDNRPGSNDSSGIASHNTMIRNGLRNDAPRPNIDMIANIYTGHDHGATTDDAIASNIRIKPHGVTFQQAAGKIMCENHRFQPHPSIVSDMDALGMRTVQDSPPGDVAIFPDMTASHPMILRGKRVQESGNSLSK